MTRAYHPTALTLVGATCLVRESVDNVLSRVRQSLDGGDGWFAATAEPEGEPIWINARQLLCVGRERTPVELLDAERLG